MTSVSYHRVDMLWNAAGIWRDVAARRRGGRNMSGGALDWTFALAASKARQRKSRMKHEHDGRPMPSDNERTDAETVAVPKTRDRFEKR